MRNRRATLALALLLCASARSARADDSPTDIAAARAYGTDGVILADGGRCAEAVPKLERAEKMHHAPTTAGRLGECLIDVGKIVAGTELLQRLVREPLGPNPPAAFTAAMERARKVLDRALPRIATIHLKVNAPPTAKVALTLDGAPLADAFIDGDCPVDPGSHVLRATARGFLPAEATTRAADGQKVHVDLKLEPDPNYRAPPPPPPAVVPAHPGTGADSPSLAAWRIPTVVAFGIGGAGLIVGGVTGILASGRTSDAESRCPDKRCVAGSDGETDLDAARTLASVSTVGFIVGGVGIAAGTVLLVLTPSSPDRSKAGVAMGARVGLGSVAISGTFP